MHTTTIFPKKQETEQVVRNRMEEQTARNKQAEAWGPALLVSAQNMGIPAHSSSVPVSAVGAAAAQQLGASFCRLSSMIQKPQWERSVRHQTVLRSSRVLLLACCHFTWLKRRLQVRTATMQRRRPAAHRVVDSSSVQSSTEWIHLPKRPEELVGGVLVWKFPRVSGPLSSASKIRSCSGRFWTKTLWRGVFYQCTHMCVSNVRGKCGWRRRVKK